MCTIHAAKVMQLFGMFLSHDSTLVARMTFNIGENLINYPHSIYFLLINNLLAQCNSSFAYFCHRDLYFTLIGLVFRVPSVSLIN